MQSLGFVQHPVFRIRIKTGFGDRICFLSLGKRLRETPTQLFPIGIAITNTWCRGLELLVIVLRVNQCLLFQSWPSNMSQHLTLIPREEVLEPKRVMSVFRERVEKHKEEIAELEEREKLVEKEKPVSSLKHLIVCTSVRYSQNSVERCKVN